VFVAGVQGVGGAQRFHNGSVISAAKQIVRQEGPAALMKGIRPRVLFHTPAAAICWSTYEAGKSFLMRWNERQNLG
jgi:solute carrier family 25 iron transporter 28/37